MLDRRAGRALSEQLLGVGETGLDGAPVEVLEEGVGLKDAEHIEFLQLSSTSMRV